MPNWEGERLLEPCSFPEGSKILHLHPDSLVTHERVCGNSLGIRSCPQSIISSLAPHKLASSYQFLVGPACPLSVPISPSRHPLACQSSQFPTHTVYSGASLPSRSLSSGAFPKPCIFLSVFQSYHPPKGGCLDVVLLVVSRVLLCVLLLLSPYIYPEPFQFFWTWPDVPVL